MLRIPSSLPDDLETLVHDTIGCCIAICLELTAAGIAFEREKTYPVMYRGELLCEQRLDFVVGGEIVLEIKSVEHLVPLHHSQLLNYMRVAHLRVGLLMNFNVVVLRDGLKRKVL